MKECMLSIPMPGGRIEQVDENHTYTDEEVQKLVDDYYAYRQGPEYQEDLRLERVQRIHIMREMANTDPEFWLTTTRRRGDTMMYRVSKLLRKRTKASSDLLLSMYTAYHMSASIGFVALLLIGIDVLPTWVAFIAAALIVVADVRFEKAHRKVFDSIWGYIEPFHDIWMWYLRSSRKTTRRGTMALLNNRRSDQDGAREETDQERDGRTDDTENP